MISSDELLGFKWFWLGSINYNPRLYIQMKNNIYHMQVSEKTLSAEILKFGLITENWMVGEGLAQLSLGWRIGDCYGEKDFKPW